MRRRWVLLSAAILTLVLAAAPALAQTTTGRVYGTPKPEPLPPHLEQKPVQGPPADVPANHWAAGAINQLRSLGIMVGDPDNNFRPNAQVTQAETVMVFLRLLGQNPSIGTGQQNWYDPAIKQATSLGWITSEQAKDASKSMDRLAVAVMLAKALKLQPATGTPPWSDVSGIPQETLGYLIALYQKGLFRGYPDGTFGPSRVVSRAEIAILVSRILSGIR